MTDISGTALVCERRVATLAFFCSTHLHQMAVRHLPADANKAALSLMAFLTQALEDQRVKFLAFAKPPNNATPRTMELHRLAVGVARDAGIPIVEVKQEQILEAYGHPPLRRREQLRKLGKAIWPTLNEPRVTRSAIDSALLGLYVQTERLFTSHQQQP